MSPILSITPLVLTARTLTVQLEGVAARHELDDPRDYVLAADGVTVQDGTLDRPVLTLESLVPGIAYTLTVAGVRPYQFVAPAEAAFIDIRDYGADPGARDNADAIKAAIAATPAGGTLYFPSGEWLTGPVMLKSNMSVWVPAGTTVRGMPDRAQYPMLPALDENGRCIGTWEGVPADCYASLFTALDADNLTISGKGTIDGGADTGDWWSWPKQTRDGARRPRTIFANSCVNLALAGITVRNSPSWTIHPFRCERAMFADLTIENPPDSPNTDGLNPESSTDVTICGVQFSVGDDCIAIKSGKIWSNGTIPPPTRNVTVTHCLMQRGHGGVVIGSEMSGSVCDVSVSRCTMKDTDRGLRIKTRRGRGGRIENIAMTDCTLDGVLTGLSVNAHYFCDPDGKSDAVQNRAPAPVSAATPSISGVRFSSIEARKVHHAVAFVLGLAESPIERLEIADITVSFAPDAEPDVPDMALGLPRLRHAGVVLESVSEPLVRGVDLPQQTQHHEEHA